MKVTAQKKTKQSKRKTTKTIVQSTEVWKSFTTGDQYTTVLKDINVEIKEGEFVILFGPSGCGKSTLLNTIMGLEYPDKGDITFMNEKIWTLNSDERAVIRKKNVGIVYQQQNWLKSLNVLENVGLVGSLLGYPKAEAQKLAKEKLELVGMPHRASYKPYELSSGEQQRISLARSLMSDPILIIADEPTGNLDVKNGLKVMQIFKDLADSGKTILMVTHNPEALESADRILFMLDGKIRKDVYVKDGQIEQIKKRIMKDLEVFIDEVELDKKVIKENTPKPHAYKEIALKKKDKIAQVLEFAKFCSIFTIAMFFLLLLCMPIRFLEKVIFKKSNLSGKIMRFITKLFNRLEGKKEGEQDSISSWALGEISLNHLMVKKSRTLITILGVGIGIGFITFLLSVGYGVERLVIGEMAEIGEMRQVVVSPTISSEVVLDDERFNLLRDIDGVSETYPLINVATTIYYGDSQTDVVAYGVDAEYLDVTRATFLKGVNFDDTKTEVVLGEEVLEMLGIDAKTVLDQHLEVEFIPIDTEEEEVSIEDEIAGIDDNRVEYLVTGVVVNLSSPIVFFSLEDAKRLGVDNYSEVLVVLEEDTDMALVRRDIENLGMKTESVMDTVAQVENLFMYLRIGLSVIGTVAFLIAVLGMVNTLTVSLLERTREVGLLKSIGMRSMEVRKLFVTESMMIAFSGGAAGVFLGIVAGCLLSITLSVMSISKGGNILGISRVPVLLVIIIVFISVIVGFITGLYPSKRAVQMSPLDALRYE